MNRNRRAPSLQPGSLWLAVLGLVLLLIWSPYPAAQPLSRTLTLDGSEQRLDLQPWIELRRTGSNTSFARILSGAGAWTAASNYDNMQFGYSSGALWMKIAIQSTAPRETLWHLNFPYSSLSRVVLFQEGQPPRTSGLGVPLADRDFPHRNAVFPLRLAPGEQTTLYLRAESVGSLGLTTQLWSSAAFASQSVSSTAMVALYCGLMLSLGLYHLLLGSSLRDGNYLLYGAHLLFFVLGVAAFSGVGGRYLWPQAGEWGIRLLPFGLTAANACALLLLRNLFTHRDSAGPWRRLLDALALISVLLALASLLLSPAWVSRSIPWLAVFSTLLAFTCLMRAVRRRLPAARLFLLGAGFVALGIMLFTLRATGLIPGHPLTDLAVQGSSAASLLTIALALARHRQCLARLQLQACQRRLESSLLTQAQAQVQLQQATSQLQELRTRLSKAALEDPLTGLASRTALQQHINHALRRGRRRATPLAIMLIDLDGFAQLRDQLGDETADRIICVTAQRLARAARESDFVARLEADEFVLVADNVSDQDEARVIAERLLDTLTPSVELEGQSISIGPSIGVTLTRAAELDMPRLLRQADLARYTRKRSGRGGVSFHQSGPVDGQPV